MPSSLSILKTLFAAFALLVVLAHPAAAQLSFNPTAEAVHEDKLLKALKEGDKISGRITIPDTAAANLIQPAGRDWRDFHRSKLPIIGGVTIIGMLAVLADLPDGARQDSHRPGIGGEDDPALRQLRALHPLADRGAASSFWR